MIEKQRTPLFSSNDIFVYVYFSTITNETTTMNKLQYLLSRFPVIPTTKKKLIIIEDNLPTQKKKTLYFILIKKKLYMAKTKRNKLNNESNKTKRHKKLY